jgi:enoyl-CoA hydratase
MACDIRITSLSAKLGLTFVTLGIHPGMASSHFLPQLIGPQAAKKMLLTGETITGSGN